MKEQENYFTKCVWGIMGEMMTTPILKHLKHPDVPVISTPGRSMADYAEEFDLMSKSGYRLDLLTLTYKHESP